MIPGLDPNKTKIAKRVIEVFEFFNEHRRTVTVTDIVREYGRPQSSTSELLASLVQMGLLYKDSRSRYYSPTPRLAAMSTCAQPSMIRDGRLFGFMERLASSTRCGVALFGIVGTHAQIFHCFSGSDMLGARLGCGRSEFLSETDAGLLLLSALNADHAARLLWRLNAEASAEQKFNVTAMSERVAHLRRDGHVVGSAGFVADARLVAALLPRSEDGRPLALGVIYPSTGAIDADALLAMIKRGIAQCATPEDVRVAPAGRLMMAV